MSDTPKKKSIIGSITGGGNAGGDAKPKKEKAPAIPKETRERSEAVAAKVTGTDVAREYVGSTMILDAANTGLDAFLAMLDDASTGVQTITTRDGATFRLASIGDLTGKRRRRFWSLVGDIGSTAFIAGDGILDMAMIAAKITTDDRAPLLYGIAYWPEERNHEFDEDEARAIGERIDDVLKTKQVAGVLWRFFISSDSSRLRGAIHTYLRPWIATVIPQPTTSGASPTSAAG